RPNANVNNSSSKLDNTKPNLLLKMQLNKLANRLNVLSSKLNRLNANSNRLGNTKPNLVQKLTLNAFVSRTNNLKPEKTNNNSNQTKEFHPFNEDWNLFSFFEKHRQIK